MERREFLLTASGIAGGVTSSVPGQGTPTSDSSNKTAESNSTNASATTTASKGTAGGPPVTVELGDFYFKPGTEEPLYVTPGTTVKFVWKTGGHNIHVDTQPDGATWKGHESIENSGFTYEHTFNVKGKYHYWCVPHKSLGMVADIIVNASGQPPGGSGGGGQKEVDPEEMGVPLQSHFVGLVTILAIMVTLVFTFFFLKYGESPHSGHPDRK